MVTTLLHNGLFHSFVGKVDQCAYKEEFCSTFCTPLYVPCSYATLLHIRFFCNIYFCMCMEVGSKLQRSFFRWIRIFCTGLQFEGTRNSPFNPFATQQTHNVRHSLPSGYSALGSYNIGSGSRICW